MGTGFFGHIDIVVFSFTADIQPVDIQKLSENSLELGHRDLLAGADIDNPFDLGVDDITYIKDLGYDLNDWALNENPVIEPEYSSVYIQNLSRKASRNIILQFMDSLVQRLAK